MPVKKEKLWNKILKELLRLAFCMLVLSAVVFVVAHLAPGDPLQAFYGDALDTMTQAEKEAARNRLGLNGGLISQYVHWLLQVLQGNFGISLQYKMPVTAVIKPLLKNTLILGLTSYITVFILAILLSIFCTLHEESLLDRMICQAGTAITYIPAFWLGVVLILIFSVNLGLLPASGAYDAGMQGNFANRIRHLILPLFVMLCGHLWYYTYLFRNRLLEEARKKYVLFAKGKGLSARGIVYKHCLRNAAPAIINVMAVSIPHITGGTVVTEAVFNYPGIGNLAVESAKYHDYNLLMVTVLITGAAVLIGGLLAQILNEQIDPRMKETEYIKW